MRPKATLKNISKNLNLSISTVSRALKDHPDISEETKKRVMEAASLLEYEPNTYAINLRTNQSRTFGLMVPEISNFFYHSFISAVEEESRKMGFSLLILQSGDDPAVELENLRICRLNRVEGLFVCLSTHTKDIKPFLKLDEAGVPVLFFDKVPSFEACNRICVADEEAGTLAASALLAKNPRHILALFGDPDLLITQKRQHSFMGTVARHETPIPVTIRYANNKEEALRETADCLESDNPPDSLFTMSDQLLTGALKAIQKKRLHIPDSIKVISICNDGFIPSLFEPEITYVETSGYQLGKLAMRRMADHRNGKTFVQELLLPCRLIEGGSL
ncbi:MAG: hypothetical protein RL732_635 [Bacteroidota bacterium]|jgi:LacI family transcriptional regulator